MSRRAAGAILLALFVLMGDSCNDKGALTGVSLTGPRELAACFDKQGNPGSSSVDQWSVQNGSTAIPVTAVAKSTIPRCWVLTLGSAVDRTKDIAVTTTHPLNEKQNTATILAGQTSSDGSAPSPAVSASASPVARASASASASATPSASSSPSPSASPSASPSPSPSPIEAPRTEAPRTAAPTAPPAATQPTVVRTPEPTPEPTPSPSPSPSPSPAAPTAGTGGVCDSPVPSGFTCVTGRTVTAAGAPVPGICVTVGPSFASCAATTDANGNFRAQLINGFAFEFNFFRNGVKVATPFTPPTSGGTVAHGNVVINQ